jgi:DNA-binding NarL/FixJ family response regulator
VSDARAEALARARERIRTEFPTPEDLMPEPLLRERETLSATQLRYVQAAAVGMNALMIASVYYVSVWTVRETLANARARSGAVNTTHLVYLCCKDGLLQ